MKLTLNRTFMWKACLFIGCLIVSSVGYYSYHLKQYQKSQETEATPLQEYMYNIHTVHYDLQGQPKDSFHAKAWQYIPDKQQSEIQQPHVTFFHADHEPWHLSATTAIGYHDTLESQLEKVDLYWDVIIEQPNSGTKISTDALAYYPQEDYVETSHFVQLQKPNLSTSGQGMHCYLKNNWMELHHDVKTEYTKNISNTD